MEFQLKHPYPHPASHPVVENHKHGCDPKPPGFVRWTPVRRGLCPARAAICQADAEGRNLRTAVLLSAAPEGDAHARGTTTRVEGIDVLTARRQVVGHLLLGRRTAALGLLVLGGGPFQKLGIAKVVIDDDLRAFEALAAFEREQQRIARTRADEIANSFRHE